MSDFKLSAQLAGHSGDVRDVCFFNADTVVTASRDHTVCAWRRTSTKPPVFEPSILFQGTAFVNSLAYLGPSAEHPDGLVLFGCQDCFMEARSPKATAQDGPGLLLLGHENNVCAIDVSPNGKWFVSGSWDGEARTWNVGKWTTQLVLEHDSNVAIRPAVWAVLAYDRETVITGCADTKIRVFQLRGAGRGHLRPARVVDTPAVVRALCKLNKHPTGAALASASNDGIIRLWTVDLQQVGELHGHDSYIYSMACLSTGEIVSAGEDRTLRVWRGVECVQTITHPAISVWCVAVCPDTDDIVTGTSDNVARVFTRDPAREADAETVAQFEETLRAAAIPAQQLGTKIDKNKLDPPAWLRSHSGDRDGQTKMIKEDDDSIGAYQWSVGKGEWISIGTVVEAPASSVRKVEYKGKEYDFVFDVDIDEDKPRLKLPYNIGENEYEVATKFLNDNELPLAYLDQVAKFIQKSAESATMG